MATLLDAPYFNCDADCNALQKAMKGLGCDAKAVIGILAARSSRQREQIKDAYKRLFGKDLQLALDSELSGDLEKIIKALMMRPAEYDAHVLNRAMKGTGTKELLLLEVLCTRTDGQRREMAAEYERLFKKSLESAIKSDTSGDFERLLVSLLKAHRVEQPVNRNLAKEDAMKLYKAGEKKFGTDEATFTAILCSNSNAHLRAVFEEYQVFSGHDIDVAIKNEVSGDYRDGLLILVQCARNTPLYFATLLHNAMKGMGTDEETVYRIVVGRCEVDMRFIKEQYQAAYTKRLEDAVASELSGQSEKAILKLIQG